MNDERPPVVLALSPVVEHAVERLLFGADAVVEPRASVGEADELERAAVTGAAVMLVSADLSGLTSAHCSRARASGMRLVGIALDESDHRALAALAVDVTIDAAADPQALLLAARGAPTATPAQPAQPALVSPRQEPRQGNVLAVVGSKGAPGSSECAASLAALANMRWPSLLVEVDVGGGALDLRLAADAQQGSLLAVSRAAAAGEGALRELLERWLVSRAGWPPVLLAPARLEDAVRELARPGAVAAALHALLALAPLAVLDVGFRLDDEDEVGSVARVHREALLAADAVVLVLGAREAQLRAGLAQLELLLERLGIRRERARIVVNGAAGPGAVPASELSTALAQRLAQHGLALDAFLPWDGRALRRATRAGLPFAVARPRSAYARTLACLLDELFLPLATDAQPRTRKLALTPANGHLEEVALPWRTS